MKAQRILIIDDDADTREVLQMALRDEFDVDMAADREIAIEFLQKSEPSAILLDYFMGGTDLPTFLGYIKKRRVRIPVILMTGAEEGAQKAAEFGLQSIAKPFSIDALTLLLRVTTQRKAAEISAHGYHVQ